MWGSRHRLGPEPLCTTLSSQMKKKKSDSHVGLTRESHPHVKGKSNKPSVWNNFSLVSNKIKFNIGFVVLL